jgi:hypothetical protein
MRNCHRSPRHDLGDCAYGAHPAAMEKAGVEEGSATMSTPGGAGTPLPKAHLQLPRVRRTGFSHTVGAPRHTGLRPFALP